VSNKGRVHSFAPHSPSVWAVPFTVAGVLAT